MRASTTISNSETSNSSNLGMLGHQPTRAVNFQGLDWTLEEQKSLRGAESRKTAKQIRSSKKEQQKMSFEKLREFAHFVVNSHDKLAEVARSMRTCNYILQEAADQGLFGEDDIMSKQQKLEMLLEGSWQEDEILFSSMELWRKKAIKLEYFSHQDSSPSPSDGDQASITSSITTDSLNYSLSSESQVSAQSFDPREVEKFAELLGYLEEEHQEHFSKLVAELQYNGEMNREGHGGSDEDDQDQSSKGGMNAEGYVPVVNDIITAIEGSEKIHESHQPNVIIEGFRRKYKGKYGAQVMFFQEVCRHNSTHAVTEESLGSSSTVTASEAGESSA